MRGRPRLGGFTDVKPRAVSGVSILLRAALSVVGIDFGGISSALPLWQIQVCHDPAAARGSSSTDSSGDSSSSRRVRRRRGRGVGRGSGETFFRLGLNMRLHIYGGWRRGVVA